MAGSAKGLGRGLDALLGGFDEAKIAPEIMLLSLKAIRANPDQPRREFTQEALSELAGSIKEKGVLQPILVRPVSGDHKHDYELVAGERRWRACGLAGLNEIPALVREVDDEESLALALIENLQREDLNPVEQANGLKQLQTRFGLKQEDLAERVGMSRSAVTNLLRLLQLSDAILEDVAMGLVSAGHARCLLSVSDEEARNVLWERIKEYGLSVRDAENFSGSFKRTGEIPELDHAPAPKKNPERKKGKKEVDARFDALANTLTDNFGLKVKFSGSAQKGRITVNFDSEQDLRDILARWGVMLKD